MNNLAEVRRLLNWSQPRAIRELRRHAESRGIRLPSDASLKRNFPRWESGLVEPGEMYQELFCAAYRRTAGELGFALARTVVTIQTEHLLAGLDLSRAAGPATGDEYAARLDAIRALDRQLGAPAALEELRALSATVEQLLKHAVLPAARRPMAAVLADAAALAGWQALDIGDLDQAWALHLTAQQAAREAGDLPALVHAMAQQAYVLLDVGRPVDALGLAQVAQEQAARDVPPVLEAWLSAVVGEMAAGAGDELGARRSLDRAAASIPDDGTDPDPMPYISLDASHLARWRGNVFARFGDHDATKELMAAFEGMDSSFTRASASLQCDLAASMLAQNDHSQARRHASVGRSLARRSGSVRQRRRIDALALSV